MRIIIPSLVISAYFLIFTVFRIIPNPQITIGNDKIDVSFYWLWWGGFIEFAKLPTNP